MLRRKYQITDSCLAAVSAHFSGSKRMGLKVLFSPKYCSLKLLPSASQSMPVLDHPASRVGKRPGLHHSQLGIWSPVHHQRKLLILEPFQLLSSTLDPWAGHSPPWRCNYVLPVQFSPPALLHFSPAALSGFPLSFHLLSRNFSIIYPQSLFVHPLLYVQIISNFSFQLHLQHRGKGMGLPNPAPKSTKCPPDAAPRQRAGIGKNEF